MYQKRAVDIMSYDYLFERFKNECVVKNPDILDLTLLELKKGYAKVEMKLSDFFKQGYGAVWGGIVIGFTDTAAPYAVMTITDINSLPPMVSLKIKIGEMTVLEDEALICEAFAKNKTEHKLESGGRSNRIYKTSGKIYSRKTGNIKAEFEAEHRVMPRSIAEKIARKRMREASEKISESSS